MFGVGIGARGRERKGNNGVQRESQRISQCVHIFMSALGVKPSLLCLAPVRFASFYAPLPPRLDAPELSRCLSSDVPYTHWRRSDRTDAAECSCLSVAILHNRRRSGCRIRKGIYAIERLNSNSLSIRLLQ